METPVFGTEKERLEAITRRLMGWAEPVARGSYGCWTDDCSEWELCRTQDLPQEGTVCLIGLTLPGKGEGGALGHKQSVL